MTDNMWYQVNVVFGMTKLGIKPTTSCRWSRRFSNSELPSRLIFTGIPYLQLVVLIDLKLVFSWPASFRLNFKLRTQNFTPNNLDVIWARGVKVGLWTCFENKFSVLALQKNLAGSLVGRLFLQADPFMTPRQLEQRSRPW